jgi:hypothetical protein
VQSCPVEARFEALEHRPTRLPRLYSRTWGERLADCGTDASLGGGDIHRFVVIGAQRTGTNILREILNTNDQIAMLGEVLSPSSAPAHWDNFCSGLPVRSANPVSTGEAEALLDQYFEFVRYRIINHWADNKKKGSHAFGVDIKYNQLTRIAPANWDSTKAPFILCYLRSRGVTMIHTTRNVIHSAISALIASQRNFWHNYDGTVINRAYNIEVEDCLAYARTIVQQRESFVRAVHDCKVINCRYDSLIDDIERSGSNGEISRGLGPLGNIARALGSAFRFRYDRSLQKAINVPYSALLSNYDVLVERLQDSEFFGLVSTL